jgi:hypothetical protein
MDCVNTATARRTAIWRHMLSVDKSKRETVPPEQGDPVPVPEKKKVPVQDGHRRCNASRQR